MLPWVYSSEGAVSIFELIGGLVVIGCLTIIIATLIVGIVRIIPIIWRGY